MHAYWWHDEHIICAQNLAFPRIADVSSFQENWEVVCHMRLTLNWHEGRHAVDTRLPDFERIDKEHVWLLLAPGAAIIYYCIVFFSGILFLCVALRYFFFIPIFNQRYFSHIWKCALSYIVRQGFDETLEIRDDDKWLNKYNSFIADIADRSSGKISNSFIVSMDKV